MSQIIPDRSKTVPRGYQDQQSDPQGVQKGVQQEPNGIPKAPQRHLK